MIRRVLALGPLLFLVGGCADEVNAPAVHSPWDHEVPLPSIVPSTAQVLSAWTLPPGDLWARYAKYTLIASLDAYGPIDELPDANDLPIVERGREAGASVSSHGVPEGTMWVVDLPGAGSVAFGSSLARTAMQRVSLVPTFNNWPVDDELVPADETLAALVQFPPPVTADPRGAPTTPVFLLDASRLSYRGVDPGDDVADNRYILTPADLPDPDTLRARGIHEVVYVVERLAERQTEEDDLHATFEAYEDAGITLTMVDLDALVSVRAAGGRWHDFATWYRYVCYPRYTIIMDPAFYARARGGFGGIHGVPGGHHPVVPGHGGGGGGGGDGAAHGGIGGVFGGHGGG